MANKQPLPDQKFKELSQAWKDSDQLPVEDREGFRNFLKQKHQEYISQYDAPLDPNGDLKSAAGALADIGGYGSGMIRTPVASIVADATGHHGLVTEQDMKDAINPFDAKPAPPIDEYLARAGVPAGAHASDIPTVGKIYAAPGSDHPWYQPEKGGMLDPSIRGTLATVGDALLSPDLLSGAGQLAARGLGITENQMLSKMTAQQVAQFIKEKAANEAAQGLPSKALGKALEYAADLPGQASQDLGKAYYKSAFGDVDRAAMKAGEQNLPSDVMFKNNAWGSAAGLEQARKAIIDKNTSAADKIINTVSDNAPDLQAKTKDVLSRASDRLQNGLATPGEQQISARTLNKISPELEPLAGVETLPIKDLNQLKKTYQEKARVQGAYKPDQGMPQNPVRVADNALAAKNLGQVYSDIAGSARRGVEDLADQYQPGYGGQIFLNNRDTKSLLNSAKQFKNSALTSGWENIRNLAPPGALAAGTYALTHSNITPAMLALAAGTGAALGTKAARTGLGLAAAQSGPALSNLVRAGLTEKYGQTLRQPSPWQLLGQEMGKDQ